MNNQNFRYWLANDSLITLAISVLFLLLPLVFINQVFETASLPRHILISFIAIFSLLIFTLKVFTHEFKLNISLLHFGFLAFFTWAVLSLLWSPDPKNTVTELTQLAVYFILGFIASQLDLKKQLPCIMLFLFIGASIAALIGVFQAFNVNPLNLKMTTPLASTFNNKNHAAVYFDLIMPLALIFMLTGKSYTKYIASITYTLLLTFIFLAKTKGSVLGFFVFTLFLLVLVYKNRALQKEIVNKKNIISYFLLTALIPLIIYSTAHFSFTQKNALTKISWNTELNKESTSIRLSWYKNAYVMLENNLFFGVGYGGFREGFTPYASSPNIVKSLNEDQAVAQLHNDPYQVILELGIFGGGIIIIAFSYIVVRGSSIIATADINNKGSPAYIFLGSLLALIAGITHSFFDFPLHLPSSAALFWFFTGIVLACFSHYDKSLIETNFFVSKKTAICLFVFTLIFSIHSFNLYHRYFSASKLTYQASVAVQKQQNCILGLNQIDQAISLFFPDAFIRQRYLQVHLACDKTSKAKLEAINKVLEYDSTNARARLSRAVIYLENNEPLLAKQDFIYLTLVLPHRPAAYLGLGDIAIQAKEFSKARKYYEKARELSPNDQHASFMLKQLKDNGL